MCFSEEEKSELWNRLHKVEEKTSKHETTLKVALGVSSAFMGILLIISGWFLNQHDDSMDSMASSLQGLNLNMAELRVTMEFYASQLNNLSDDFRSLHEDVESHDHD